MEDFLRYIEATCGKEIPYGSPRQLESLTFCLPHLAPERTYARPHRVEERSDSKYLCHARRHHEPAQPSAARDQVQQLSRYPGGRAERDEPVSSAGNSGAVARVS